MLTMDQVYNAYVELCAALGEEVIPIAQLYTKFPGTPAGDLLPAMNDLIRAGDLRLAPGSCIRTG